MKSETEVIEVWSVVLYSLLNVSEISKVRICYEMITGIFF